VNTTTFQDIKIHDQVSFSVTVTAQDFESFKAHSHDDNPLHNDAAYAQEQGYPDKVAYGMLSASYLSTLAGVYLPGKYALIHTVNLKFLKPVFAGDTLTITGEVVDKNETFRFIDVKAVIRNQNDIAVCKAQMQIGVLI